MKVGRITYSPDYHSDNPPELLRGLLDVANKRGRPLKEVRRDLHRKHGCPKCGQTDKGQTGEYPCEVCGLPTLHDE